ncbi:MAG: hypothetical protein ACXAC5_24355 [Promethearchaeota archaeon]|jgi:steroid 5-alpha reductase family enzyme
MLIKSYIICSLSYLIAFLIAILVLVLLNTYHPIVALFIADLSATLVIYLIGSLYKNASLYDAYWSVFPLFIIIYWLIYAEPLGINSLRQILIVLLEWFKTRRLALFEIKKKQR